MAPPKNLVTGVCILLAVPVSYGVTQLVSLTAGIVALVVIGIVVPQAYGRWAVPENDRQVREEGSER